MLKVYFCYRCKGLLSLTWKSLGEIGSSIEGLRYWFWPLAQSRKRWIDFFEMHSAWEYKDYCVFSLRNKLFHDISRATFFSFKLPASLERGMLTGWSTFICTPRLRTPHRRFYWKLNLLQRVGSLSLGYLFQQLSRLIIWGLCHTLAVI